jgi:hypothetical protein
MHGLRLGADEMTDTKPPFDNCKFDMCDLPGQCRSEGKCHHPKAVTHTKPTIDEHSCSYHCDRPECIKAQRELMREELKRIQSAEMTADELLREARVLLNRYWLEVPLGHQPRMIAADAESVVSRIDAHLASHQSDYDKGLLRAAEICAIEEAIAAGKMTAPMVFTKMRELIRASPRSRRNRD